MSMNGTAGSGPLKMPVALIDILAGHHLKEAILMALLKRQKTKQGSHVSVSLFDVAVASLANQASNWLIGKHIPQPSGSLHPNIAPYGELFQTKDGHTITFAIGSNQQFMQLCQILSVPELALHKNYTENQIRVQHRKKLFALLKKEVIKQNLEYLQTACTQHAVPFAKVRNMQEVFELPQAQKLLKKIKIAKQNYTVVGSFPAKIK